MLKKLVAILACKPIVRELIALPYYTRIANIIVPGVIAGSSQSISQSAAVFIVDTFSMTALLGLAAETGIRHMGVAARSARCYQVFLFSRHHRLC